MSHITDNYSISRFFITKEVVITIDKKDFIKMKLKTVRDFFEDSLWNGIYHMWTQDIDEWHKMFPPSTRSTLSTEYDYIKFIVFDLGIYKQYRDIADTIQKYFQELFEDVDFNFTEKEIIINGVTITSQIWNYIIYLLKLSQGEKATQPRTFSSPEEEAFYRKQLEYEKRINQVRAKAKSADGGDKEGLIKTCLYIIYAFPALNFEYLFDQTMAQIYWLQKMAAGSISYGFNEKAFAAGNVKKGKKLDFFIK